MRKKKSRNPFSYMYEKRELTLLDLSIMVLVSMAIGIAIFLISNIAGYVLLSFGILAVVYKILPYFIRGEGS